MPWQPCNEEGRKGVALKGAALRDRIGEKPEWAMKRILAQKPWDKQVEIAKAVFLHPRVEVSGCVSSTKTYCAAMMALLWLMRWGRGSRVFSIAPSFRQVDTNLWGYIPKLVAAAERNGTPLGCRVFKEPRVEFGDDWYYEGFSTDKPGNVHGIHGDHDLLIVDDWQGVDKALMEELDNMTAGGACHFLCLHNRVVLSGPSYDCAHKDAALWHHIGISFWDMPNSDPKRQAEHIPGALCLQTVDFWKRKYGAKSNFYRNKVDNEYPTAAPDTLIPLDWVELAFARKAADQGPLMLGGDVARFGDDSSAKARMRGRSVQMVTSWSKYDLMHTAGEFAQDLRAETAPGTGGVRKSAFAFLDVVGMGGGPVDRLVEQRIPNATIVGVDCGEKAEGMALHGDKWVPAHEVFVNKRSQMWWNLRERLDPSASDQAKLVSLPVDLELQAQLTCVRYRLASDGRIEVEPKHSSATNGGKKWGLKNRLGYSPDKGDAVVVVVWGADTAVQGEVLTQGHAAAGQAPGTAQRASSDFPFASAAGGDDGYMDGMECA